MPSALRKALTVLLGAAALAIAACSGVRFAYDYADNYFVGTVQDHFDPSPEQLRVVRANAQQVMTWHRRQELPLYAAMFEQAAQRAIDGLTEDDVLWGLTQVRMRYDTLVERIVAAHTPLLAQLGADNITALKTKFAGENTKLEQSYIKGVPTRREERRIERVKRQLERWTGALDDKQHAIVAAWVAAAPNAAEDWYRERLSRQQKLLDVLRDERDVTVLRTRVTELWQRSAAPSEQRERQERRLAALLVAIDQSLSSVQRERAVQRMRQYAEDFRKLMQ